MLPCLRAVLLVVHVSEACCCTAESMTQMARLGQGVTCPVLPSRWLHCHRVVITLQAALYKIA